MITPIVKQGSKVGIHSLQPRNTFDFVRQLHARGARFPVVKAVNDMDWLSEVKQLDSEIVTIGRLTTNDEGLQKIEYENDMQRRADYLFAPIVEKLRLNPKLKDDIDYWEICNEPDPPHHPPEVMGYAKLGECMIACMERAAELGLKIAILGLNAGTPEWDETVSLVDTGVFGVAKRGGHIVTLHEGVFADFITGDAPPIDLWWGDLIPGSPRVEGAGALCFRYRYLYHLLKQRDEVVPLVISETYYGHNAGLSNSKIADIISRIQWYDEQAKNDSYLLAHLPFTLGSYGDTEGQGWRNADYKDVYPSLMDEMVAIKDRWNAGTVYEPPTPPVVEPPVVIPPVVVPPVVVPPIPNPEPETETVKAATYNLLPPDVSALELWTVARATYDDRETLGFSAESAGMFAYAVSATAQIVSWAPERTGETGQQRWHNHFYPGVTLWRKWFGAPKSPPAPDAVGATARKAALAAKVAHTYHLLPEAATLSDFWSVLRRLYKEDRMEDEGLSVGFSAENGAKLVVSGSAESQIVVWQLAGLDSQTNKRWLQQNFPQISIVDRQLQRDQWDW